MLNKNQLEAVNHVDGAALILAGPGSGKTRVITHRILNLIKLGVHPKQILAITFTKAASLEMKNRCVNLDKISKEVEFGTFHGVFFKWLRSFSGFNVKDVLQEDERRKLIKQLLKQAGLENYEDEDFLKDVLNDISYFKNNLEMQNSFFSKSMEKEKFQKIYLAYETYKIHLKKIDFDDMLLKTFELLRKEKRILEFLQKKYKYILIDEFQDINKVQFEVIKLVSCEYKNLFVVGDDDQSIYKFRGSNPEFMIDFKKYFQPLKVVNLDINYRSTPNILDVAQKLIKNNKQRMPKKLSSYNTKSKNVQIIYPKDSREEATFLMTKIKDDVERNGKKYKDFAILYRTHIQSRSIVDVLMENNIPFFLKDGMISIYDHWIAKDILSYLKLTQNQADFNDCCRIINRPFRYISRLSIKNARASQDFFTGLKKYGNLNPLQLKAIDEVKLNSNKICNFNAKDAIDYIRSVLEYDRYLLDYCMNNNIKSSGLHEILEEISEASIGFEKISDYINHMQNFKEKLKIEEKNENDNKVTLTTFHSSKGLEYDEIYIIGALEEIIPHNKSLDDEMDIEEERRLFYVGITRAKKNLIISSPKLKYGKKSEVSRFILEILKESFNEEDKIYHSIFKEGIVKKIDKEKLIADFKGEKKSLNWKLCIKKNLLKKLNS